MTVQVGMLPDGRRLHLNHGPIDLIVEAFGAPDEVRAAYRQAAAGFADVLPTLVRELKMLRTPLPKNIPSRPASVAEGRVRGAAAPEHDDGQPLVAGPVARRMVEACWPYRGSFITPMAAVAGSVADHVLSLLLAGRSLLRAYVNDGGDIAFHLTAGQALTCGLVADVAAPSLDGTLALTADLPVRGLATSGRAGKGQGGRSFSFGIADAVTVLARDGAAADAAATVIANAVDLPGHPAVMRGPASAIDPDSDLGDRPVTLDVGDLSEAEIRAALARGVQCAEDLRRSGLIFGAVLVLRRRFATVGAGLQRLAAA
jgi:ApbE superfamily uncharacterized protein (UPF0280 family)